MVLVQLNSTKENRARSESRVECCATPARSGKMVQSCSLNASTLLLACLLAASCLLCVCATDPPEITIRPRNQQVRANGVAAFYCAARGDPVPNIQWRKNGKRVSGTQSRYHVSEMGTAAGAGAGGAVLRIEPVRAGRDDAAYECVAENGVGDAVSATATLAVFESDKVPGGFPTVASAPSAVVVEVGHTANLPCHASGSPAPRVRWLRDSLPLDVDANRRYMLLQDKLIGALQILESEEQDQAKYECVAENSIGTEYSKATSLYVKVRRVSPQFSIPPPPLSEVMLGGNLTLQCVAYGSPMPTVRWRKGMGQDITPEDKQPIGRNVLELTDIRESENYTCVAASVLGVVEQTAVVKVQSLPGAPTNVRASEITATSVRLTWSYNGPENPQYYVIQFKPKYANQAYSEISGIITMYYSVRSLSPYTEYELYVVAANNIGRGPRSAPAVVTTGETEPGTAPRNVHMRPLSSSTMVVQWDEPETPNGQVTAYKVYYTTDPSLQMQSWHSQVVDNNQLTTISDLTPHTVYTIRVQAFTSVGPGPLSAPVQVKTQQGVPSQPSNLRSTDIGETSVTLQWNRPAHSGENIVSYELYWNDTYAKEKHHRRISITETYTLSGLYPNTLYYVWLAARSQRGEGATTPPIPVRTKQYGKIYRGKPSAGKIPTLIRFGRDIVIKLDISCKIDRPKLIMQTQIKLQYSYQQNQCASIRIPAFGLSYFSGNLIQLNIITIFLIRSSLLSWGTYYSSISHHFSKTHLWYFSWFTLGWVWFTPQIIETRFYDLWFTHFNRSTLACGGLYYRCQYHLGLMVSIDWFTYILCMISLPIF